MKLIDVCNYIVDCPHSTANDEGTGYPLIRTPNIGRGRLILSGVHRVCEDIYNLRNARAIPMPGDIILAREAPAGNVALIQPGEKVCLGQRTVLISPDFEKVNPQYLTYYLLAPKQQHAILSSANGATVAHVNMPKIRNLEISLPSLEEQNNIVDILSPYDEIITNNQQEITLAEEALYRIYSALFSKINNQVVTDVDVSLSIPSEWKYAPLSSIITFIRGKSYSSNELSDSAGTIMVNLKNINAYGGYKHKSEKHFIGQFKPEQTLAGGDLIMGVTDMTQDRRLVGHVAIVPHFNEKVTFSMDIIKIMSNDVPNSYLYSVFRYGGISKQISALANGVNVLHLRPENMLNIKIVVPPRQVLLEYDNLFCAYSSKIELLYNQIDLLTDVRERLIKRLFSE